MNDSVEPEGTAPDADAEQAFSALASEVATLRAAVESLPQMIDTLRAPNYSADLGKIAKQLARVDEDLKVLRSFPYLSMTPQQHGEAIAQAGKGLIADAAKEFEKGARTTHFEGEKLKSFLGHAREVHEQRTWLIRAAAGGLAVGLILFPLVATILPFGLNERIAAGIVGKDRWGAGQVLMEAGNPQGFAEIVQGNQLVTLNEGKIKGCRDAARKAKKEQACSITVPEP